jgi:integrase
MSNARYRPGSLELIKTAAGKCWYIRFQATINGKTTRARQRVGLEKDFPNKSAAKRAAQGIVDEFNRVPDITRAEKRRFNELIDRYKLEEMPKRYSTAKAYKAILRNQIEPKWGREFLDDVEAMDVRAWLKSLDCSSRYKGHIHGLMRILFGYAMLWKWIPRGENPMSLFRMEGSTRRQKEPNILTVDQLIAILREIEQPIYRLMVLYSIGLGLRCSELFALKWKDFVWSAPAMQAAIAAGDGSILPDLLKIERAVVDGNEGEVKTIHSKKPLPLHADLAVAAVEFRKQTEFDQDDDWVFASAYIGGDVPMRPGNVQRRILIPAGKRAGLPFTLGWHTFRHTYKSWLDDLEIPLTVQRDLMRHAHINTTAQVYGSVGMKRLRSANERLIEMPVFKNKKGA